MSTTLFSNARIFHGEKGFVKGSFSVINDRFGEILPETETERRGNSGLRPNEEANLRSLHALSGSGEAGFQNPGALPEPGTVDLQGLYVLPGLVDIHTHGNSGSDFSDGSAEGLRKMGSYLASNGITSFLPTSMTLPFEKLANAYGTAAAYALNRPADGARALGIHMEGPYFSEKKKGAQNGAFLKLPDADEFFALQEACGHRIRIVDIAPELPGAELFVRRITPHCRVSLAHTDASYEEACRAFDAGASHVTHLFNAMPQLHHREPGVIGAACDQAHVSAELICDGLHIHPAVVRLAFRLFPGRICLISDALRCCGMDDGIYELGGQQVTLKNGQARLPDGNLAGAVSNLYEDMVNAIRFGIKKEEAILAATMNPAKAAGVEKEIGSLETGKKADFIICDSQWNLRQVYIDGKSILPIAPVGFRVYNEAQLIRKEHITYDLCR